MFNHLILCIPPCLLSSVFPCIRVFSSESALHIRWPQYWSFSSSISPTNEYSGLIYFRIDSFDFLPVKGTLKILLRHHISKASILQCSAFFRIQLSHPYMTTGKTIALTIQTFVGKMMSLLFNTLSSFVIAFFPRRKYFLISWKFFQRSTSPSSWMSTLPTQLLPGLPRSPHPPMTRAAPNTDPALVLRSYEFWLMSTQILLVITSYWTPSQSIGLWEWLTADSERWAGDLKCHWILFIKREESVHHRLSWVGK